MTVVIELQGCLFAIPVGMARERGHIKSHKLPVRGTVGDAVD